MHRAPAVRYAVYRSRWHAVVIAFLWSLGAAATTWLGVVQEAQSWTWLVILLTLIGSALCAVRGWVNASVGQLHWDGCQWRWEGYDQIDPCQVRWHWDFQAWMLVSAHFAQGRPLWLWLERKRGDVQWAALRRALVDSAKHEGDGLQTELSGADRAGI